MINPFKFDSSRLGHFSPIEATALAIWQANFGTRNVPCQISVGNRILEPVFEEMASKWGWNNMNISHVSSTTHKQVLTKRVSVNRKRSVLLLLGYNDLTMLYPYGSPVLDKFIELTSNAAPSHLTSTRVIHIPIQEGGRLETQAFKLPDGPEGDILDNYNEDFEPVHQNLINRLQDPDGRGIAILHGSPGTGKTSYIRYLCEVIPKKVIYVPQEMAGWLAQPQAIPFLSSQAGSVLVIEDAEHMLRPRASHQGDSAVTTLLNLTDGLLADCMRVQVVCTFNANVQNIDEALLRPGRLMDRYEFKELTRERAKRLAQLRGLPEPSGPTSLASLFCAGGSTNTRKAIGFATANQAPLAGERIQYGPRS